VEAGLVASLFASAVTGVTVSIVFGGVMTLIAAAVVGLATPVIRDYASHADAA
jgi:tetrahydromethanopterin S-methyltransferase subunit C